LSEAFTLSAAGQVVGSLEHTERVVLTELMSQLIELLAPTAGEPDEDPLAREIGIAEDAPEPSDPALKRLLPNAYRFEPELSTEFRRYTERELRDGKISRAKLVIESLAGHDLTADVVELNRQQAETWAMSLADLRIALGAKLGLFEEGAIITKSPEQSVYDWLTWLQGTLIEALQSQSLS
jgi:hypothetical protein